MIDTHQHLLYPELFAYPWVGNVPALAGPFRLEEYGKSSQGCGIKGCLFMEVDAAQPAAEARFFCGLAEDSGNGILGVIASARPEHDGFEASLDAIAHPKLAGIRRVLHTQPDGLSQSGLFRENLRALGRRGLPFDLCVLQRQLPVAHELIRACPEVSFVLDHCGVPDIAANAAPDGEGFRAWREGVRAIASAPNVCCKISGLTAYASDAQRTADGLRPYVETVLESFGPARCVWGGDWPVVNLGSGLARWCDLSRELLSGLSADEQDAVFARNATQVYHLDP